MNLPWPLKELIKPSTSSFWREAKKEKLPWAERIHAYIYGRWSYFYISMAIGEHPMAKFLKPSLNWLGRRLSLWQEDAEQKKTAVKKSFADSYHGKVVPLDDAKKILRLDRDIEFRGLEKVVPYTTARDIVLKNPNAIAVMRCPCRASRENPCRPLDVCLIIGEPFANFIVEHHPGKAKWITTSEALAILTAEDKLGHVHHAFFKEAMLGRFYAICNCCSCCCGAMQAQRNGVPMLASSGYVCRAREKGCEGCGMCLRNCQFEAIEMVDNVAFVHEEKCMGCGVCVNNCPQNVLYLEQCPQKGQPLDVQCLMESEIQKLMGDNA
ncbi:MAG: indolepyruvate ferredoxin oxidoreductase subunit alpha [Thermodesulfobacteriota bacterium]